MLAAQLRQGVLQMEPEAWHFTHFRVRSAYFEAISALQGYIQAINGLYKG